MHRGRVGTGEQQFNRHRAEWTDCYAHGQPHPGFDQRNVDRAEWAKRYPIDDVRGREFTNDINGSQWRRRYPQRLRPGHGHGDRDHDWTAGCDRDQGSHALNGDWGRSWPRPDDSEARLAFSDTPLTTDALKVEPSLHDEYTASGTTAPLESTTDEEVREAIWRRTYLEFTSARSDLTLQSEQRVEGPC